MVKLPPELRVTPETVMVWPETATVPVEAVVYPAFDPEVDGALQPLGTTTVTAPPLIPPLGAVYVKLTVFPLEAADTPVVVVVRVPAPPDE
jgi:hypothetical protein